MTWSPQPLPPYAQSAPFAPSATTDAAAITALCLAIGAFMVPIAPAVVALFMASAAKRSIAASEGTRKGRGLAIAAQCTAIAALLLTVLLVTIVAVV